MSYSSCRKLSLVRTKKIRRLLFGFEFLVLLHALYIALFSLQERCWSVSLVTGALKPVTCKETSIWNAKVQVQNHREMYVGMGLWSSPRPCSKQGSRWIYSRMLRALSSWVLKVSKDGDVFLGNLLMSSHCEFFFLMSNPTFPCCRLCPVVSGFITVHLWEGSGCFCNSPPPLSRGWLLVNPDSAHPLPC